LHAQELWIGDEMVGIRMWEGWKWNGMGWWEKNILVDITTTLQYIQMPRQRQLNWIPYSAAVPFHPGSHPGG
jgi:hypothetical protein